MANSITIDSWSGTWVALQGKKKVRKTPSSSIAQRRRRRRYISGQVAAIDNSSLSTPEGNGRERRDNEELGKENGHSLFLVAASRALFTRTGDSYTVSPPIEF